ncbi:MAG: transferase [Syntrophus sp. (in: bacteria)]|nr:transferase [Syntrophus sp. (in: bacteria)]
MTISEQAVVETKNIGANVTIGEFSIVRPHVVIGNDVIIHPYVIINEGTVLGDGVEIFSGSIIGKEPKGAGALARPPRFERRVIIGANTSVGPHAVIYYDVEIGNHTLVGDGASIREQCRIGAYCIISRYVTINYNVKIGDRTKVMDLTHVTGNCIIGDDVFISLTVGMANDNLNADKSYAEEKVKGPRIDNGAVIGVGATLLPGVIIGENAVVGAGSVVTKNVERETLVMGVPAAFRRFVVKR